MPTNLELARIAFSHYELPPEERDVASFQPLIDLLAEDAVFEVTLPADTPVYGGEIRGKQAVTDFLTVQDRELCDPPEFDGPMEFFWNDSDRVVFLGGQTVKIKPTGDSFHNYFVGVLDFRDGKITRILSVEDCTELIVALAKLPARGQPAGS